VYLEGNGKFAEISGKIIFRNEDNIPDTMPFTISFLNFLFSYFNNKNKEIEKLELNT
jgi:hypothetical protein